MSYVVLARRWRPSTFDEMVGQEFVSRTLKNAVQSGRVAHAFLFTGPRGVGKTSAARILAKCLNCDQGPTVEPCNRCTSCVEITEGRSTEVYEIDGASNTSVDDVRELRENVRYLPRPGKRRIYIIDEVHMLSKSAFNALLKTLEEPPEHVVFIFATTEPHKVLETIQSRCQRFDFRRIPRLKLVQRLREMTEKEKVRISDNALSLIAKSADGSMRDAQSLLDQVISFCGGTVEDQAVLEILGVAGPALFTRISDAIFGQDAAGCLDVLDEVNRYGYDVGQFFRDLVEHFRNLLVARVLPNPERVLDLAEGEIEDLKKQAGKAGKEDLQRLVNLLLRAEKDVLGSSFPRIGLEATLIRMAHVARLEPLEKILETITALEQSGVGRAPGAAGPDAKSPAERRYDEPGARGSERPSPASELPGRRPAWRSQGPEPQTPVSAGSDEPGDRVPTKGREPQAGSRTAAGPPESSAAGGTPAGPAERSEEPSAGPRSVPGRQPDDPRSPHRQGAAPVEPPAGVGMDGPEAANRFVQAVRKERGGLAALLEDVAGWEIDPDFITAYCEQGSFLYEKLRQPEVRELLTRIGRACLRSSAQFRVRSLTERSSALSSGAKPGPAANEPGPGQLDADQTLCSATLRSALDLFHGTITEVKPLEKEKGS